MSDYQYDLFISTKHADMYSEWLDEHFLPLFEAMVKQDIANLCKRQAKKFFYYKRDIPYGESWKNSLRRAISFSRVAIAVCSPQYFLSDYCLMEFHSFYHRNKTKNAEVLLPISVHDGESFPPEALEFQISDFKDYVFIGPAFKASLRFIEFQEQLRPLSRRVAELVAAAPPFEKFDVIEMSVSNDDPPIRLIPIS